MLSEAAKERMAKLKANYHQSLGNKLFELRRAWDRIEASKWSEERLLDLQLQVHRLAGSAASYGYRAISDIATRIDLLITDVEQERRDQAWRSDVTNEFITLTSQLATAARSEPGAHEAAHGAVYGGLRRKATNTSIYLIDSDQEGADHLAAQLAARGFPVTLFTNPQAALRAAMKDQPAMVICALSFPKQKQLGFELVNQMQQVLGYLPSTVILADQDDFDARLKGARLGVLAYYTKPVNIEALIAVVDDCVSTSVKRPYRLLFLEDDGDQVRWIREAFADSAVSLRVLSQPDRISETLVGYKPEAVVVDLHDKDLLRTDVIRVIRQHDYGADLPVLIFGRGIDMTHQLLALKAGADDILLGDAEPLLLVQQVTNHCKRYRRMVHRMMYDALTGVLNRDAFIERVDEEIGRAKRAGESYAMAMIDLDGVQALREQQGELMADIATKCLAALVHRRLRKTDVLGRFSGGELVAFLPTTTIELAVNVFEDIGRVLRSEPFTFGDHSLELDVCVGIATGDANHTHTVDELLAAADELLYHAKRKGPGQVVAR